MGSDVKSTGCTLHLNDGTVVALKKIPGGWADLGRPTTSGVPKIYANDAAADIAIKADQKAEEQ